ncbi:peptide ABC transporter permease [Marinitoga sp. 1135]|uniref:ABC-type dipeptide/oligopeptide/nickel transport system, permease component n=1 Tax=Marinitoga piezophila (strain DSM 14283 / JCM 11233 / KA3) TaxID=443254 RepID=H2J7U7_MARPK|nr:MULTISPECIES: ABC transporter permease [Marinitoga]AEX85438.1 ABC-type dipeptide/oligopeptide/nickel transport system, permease component [Marinitoga piezophila KA3]APT75913.1 peptide ABC transporter permease [Marinitoga sp. 1137]NUU95659.1 peptide ABC transporter permease [Marinitoga sp. 1135]NUU97580.1 peptide ABC transporter permease [Marinitoga sp. 1138]
MNSYLKKKFSIYFLTFFVAITIDWAIPRFMPGNPVALLMGRFAAMPGSRQLMMSYFTEAFGLNKPLLTQYIDFWKAFFHGDLGVSLYLYPKPVMEVIKEAIPYDLMLLLPSILLSWIVGNKLGAYAIKNKFVEKVIIPLSYFFTAMPYFWFAIILAWFLGVVNPIFPISGAYSYSINPEWSVDFILDFLSHWILPFLSLFMVMLGGWAIGMRNMIIYEVESNYSRYMRSLGLSQRLRLNYAYKNALLPQITGLALQLGTIVAGALTTEVVFSYPGIGYLLLQAILHQDYFLIQGCFLFIVLGVLIANFIVDIVYVLIDPRVKASFVEGA